jgi:methylamine dehydrogenase accessory protein MauD
MLTGVWWVSYFLLWSWVCVEAISIVALARQIGILHERLGPVGARTMNPGPRIGQPAPAVEATDINGRSVSLGATHGARTLMVFISTQCSTCAEIMPTLRTLYRTESRDLEIMLISADGSELVGRAYARQHDVAALPFVVSSELAKLFQVGLSPYAVMIDRTGVVRAKGVVNNTSHIESLLNAEESGFPNIQSFLHLNDIQAPPTEEVHSITK